MHRDHPVRYCIHNDSDADAFKIFSCFPIAEVKSSSSFIIKPPPQYIYLTSVKFRKSIRKYGLNEGDRVAFSRSIVLNTGREIYLTEMSVTEST